MAQAIFNIIAAQKHRTGQAQFGQAGKGHRQKNEGRIFGMVQARHLAQMVRATKDLGVAQQARGHCAALAAGAVRRITPPKTAILPEQSGFRLQEDGQGVKGVIAAKQGRGPVARQCFQRQSNIVIQHHQFVHADARAFNGIL